MVPTSSCLLTLCFKLDCKIVDSLEDPLEKGQAIHSSILGLHYGSADKESTCNVGDLGSIPGLGRSPGEGKGYPFQYSGLKNSIGCMVHEVAKSQTRLSNFHFHIGLY